MKTYGYDYSYAITQDKLNEILAHNLASVEMRLTYNGKDPQSGAMVTIDAQLTPWRMAPGGQNTLLRIETPISQGYMSVEGLPPSIPGSFDLSKVTLILEISLGWLGPGDKQELEGEGDLTGLVFYPSDTSSRDNPGYVSVINVLDPDGTLGSIGKGFIRQYAQAAFFSSRDNLKYVFAGVYPVPPHTASWLRPVKWQYYVSSGSIEALCFLCQLSDKAFPQQPGFDSRALSASCNAVALISQETFFANVPLPAVRRSFPNGSFHLGEQNQQSVITNSGHFNVDVDGKQVTTYDFSMTPSDDGNGLATNAAGGGPLKFFFGIGKLPEASYSWSVKTTNPLHYDHGTERITFQSDPHPTTTHNQDVKWYDWVILVALGITNIGSLVEAIMDAVNGFSDDVNVLGMNDINQTLQTAIGGSVVNLTTLLNWQAGGQSFQAVTAGLDGALYVQGNIG